MVMQTTGQQPQPEDMQKRRTGVDGVGGGSRQEEGGQAGQDIGGADRRVPARGRCSITHWRSSLSICRSFRSRASRVRWSRSCRRSSGRRAAGSRRCSRCRRCSGPGVAVRHLVDAGCGRHRQRQRDREVTADARGTERSSGSSGLQPGRGTGCSRGIWARRAVRQLGHDRCRTGGA